MTDRLDIPNSETLFAFDLLVEYIRIDIETKVSDELALGVRLLDFPTLLIYQPQAGGHVIPRTLQENDKRERENHLCPRPGGDKYAFNKGKSCLFKMNLDSLHKHLSNTPLYAMVLDVKDEVPKLVGSSQISLAKLMDRIKSDINAHGISTPSCQGEKILIDIFNLMCEKIGLISLGYKLLSLGASLLPHISENKAFQTGGACEGENTSPTETQSKESWLNLHNKPGLCENIQQNGHSVHEAKQEVVLSAATQTEHRPRSKSQQTLQVNDFTLEEDVTAFCPPHLFYTGTAEKTSKNQSDDYKLLKLDLESLVVDDARSEDEASGSEYEGRGYPVIDQRTRQSVNQPSSRERQETTGLTPNTLGETLRQLPLLNALLIELSQLSGQTQQQQQQPLAIHPNLAWIYQPGLGNTLTDVHTTSPLHTTTRQSTSPRLKGVHHPQGCSTPRGGSVSGGQVKNVKREDVCLVCQPPDPSPRKKLVYGTTKTSRLRLKQITPGVARRRECTELTETQTHKTKGKISNTNQKHANRKKTFNRSSSLDENIENVISSIAEGTSPQEATALKKRNEDGNKPQRCSEAETSCCGRRDDSPKPSEKSLHSTEEKKLLIQIPNVDDPDAAQNSDDNGVRLESNETQTEPYRSREKGETTGSSRFNSPKSSYSPSSSSGGQEEVEYPDDFTSLEPSDGYSPDPTDVVCSPEPLSSPEPASAKAKVINWKKVVSMY